MKKLACVLLAITALAFALALAGCTPKREAALTNLAADKLQCLALCAAELITRPAGEILATCGARCGKPQGNDLQNYLDLIAGQKAGATAAGASIPKDPDPGAGSGYTPKGAQ